MRLGIFGFELSDCRYALPLSDVLEVVRAPTIVPLPKAPAIVEGAVNIRGKVVPVLDIRTRFRLHPKLPWPTDFLIVAQAGSRRVALRVERLNGLAEIDADAVEDPSAVTPRAEYVAGVVKQPDGLVLLHDLATFLAESEARTLDEVLAPTEEGEP